MFSSLRQQMVEKYVIGAGVTDCKVIEAMRRVPRHLFVDAALQYRAYSGTSLPIGFKQTISHPTTVAQMTSALELRGTEKVLEIGTGSGYQAAVLAEMGVKVFTIERIAELAERARQIFETLNYFTIALKIGDGYVGWQQYAPFRRILLTAHSKKIPESLLQQLDSGGILLMPLGSEQQQSLVKITRQENGQFQQETLSAASFVPLVKDKAGELADLK